MCSSTDTSVARSYDPVQIQLKTNVDKIRKELKRTQRKQIPFALSLALNNTAFATRRYVVEKLYPRAFPGARNKTFARRTFKVGKSTKYRLHADVHDDLKRGFLDNHIHGRAKRPRGQFLAVRTRKVPRLAAGGISKAKRPANLKKSFVADLRGRGPAVWQRHGRGGRKIKLMYTLRRTTPVDQSFDFYTSGERFVARVFPGELERAVARALRSAR